MALQINGTLENNYATYSNPQIQLVPHLTYRGGIAMDVNIFVEIPNQPFPGQPASGTTLMQVSAIAMYPENSSLVYPSQKVDPYSDLIYSLETYVISQISGSTSGTITRF